MKKGMVLRLAVELPTGGIEHGAGKSSMEYGLQLLKLDFISRLREENAEISNLLDEVENF